MTQEQKDLLLKDLCARVPYGVKCSHKNEGIFSLTCIDLEYNYIYVKHGGFKIGEPEINHKHIKPYLFPLSSMTEEQYYELQNCSSDDCLEHMELVKTLRNCTEFTHWPLYEYRVIDWFHKNHFDYRGLIPIGLANDATGLNIY